MGAFDRAYDSGRVTGIRQAIAVVLNEPDFEGPMPLSLRVMAMAFPERASRAAGAAWRASVLRKLRALLDEHTG